MLTQRLDPLDEIISGEVYPHHLVSSAPAVLVPSKIWKRWVIGKVSEYCSQLLLVEICKNWPKIKTISRFQKKIAFLSEQGPIEN